MYTVYGFYKFKKIQNIKKNKIFFQRELLNNRIRGTLIISPEGINGTISGIKIDVTKFINLLKKKFRIKNFDSKNNSLSKFHPFHKGKIKIKKEVVPIGLIIKQKNKKPDNYLIGKSWNKFISNKETLVIDTRKSFEYEVGTFMRSINPNVNNFREFPNYLKKLKKNKTILGSLRLRIFVVFAAARDFNKK